MKSRKEKKKLLLLSLEEKRKRIARNSLLAFTRYTFPDYNINWHHKVICNYLDKFANKEIKRLMLFMPPRHGKSELGSRRLPAFILGKFPDSQIISTSYSDSLAAKMNRDTQRIIDSEFYNQLFPDTVLPNSPFLSGVTDRAYIRKQDEFEIIGKKGGYRSAGVGGGITGMGADYAIIDDPIKNMQEALSPAVKKSIYEWYQSTLFTRLQKNGSVLLILTRWAEDDLAGRLLEQTKNDPNAIPWTVVSFPAIREYHSKEKEEEKKDPRSLGEPLWPDFFPIETLLDIKGSIGSMVWQSLYQQDPTPLEGNMIKRESLKFYSTTPTYFEKIILSWDFNFKDTDTADFTVGQAWGIVGSRKYLIDQVRDRMSFTSALRAIKNMIAKFPDYQACLIEEAANGIGIKNSIEEEVSRVIGIKPRDSKAARLSAVTPEFEAGNVFIPENAPWTGDFIQELVSFPNWKNDDQVDATTQVLNYLRGKRVGSFIGLDESEEKSSEKTFGTIEKRLNLKEY